MITDDKAFRLNRRFCGFHPLTMSSYAEYTREGDFAPMDVVAACFEQSRQDLLIDRQALPAKFFDLRTGVTGELVQKLNQYGIRLACVVPDLRVQPERFQEFAREVNRGSRARFFESREDAVGWLERSERPRSV